MQKISILLALSVVILSTSLVLADPQEEEGVLIFTDANFDTEIAKHEFILVEFYAPWCGHCKQLAPEYAKAAQKLRQNNPPFYLAKVDATENKALAERFAIKGFPTLFWFKEQKQSEYNGGRTENEIVNWILKRVGPSSVEVTCDQLKQKSTDAKLLVAYFGEEKTKEHGIFIDVSSHGSVSEKFQFVNINNKECMESYGMTSSGLILFRQFDESPLIYSGAYELGSIVDWMVKSSVPTLIEFSEDYIEPIFGQRKSAIFLFRKKEDANKPYAKIFEEAAISMKGQILFVVSGATEGIQARLAEFVGVDDSSMPQIKLLDPENNMKKFQFSGNMDSLTLSAIQSFVNDFKAGKLQPFLKSADIPADNSQPVKTIVGKNFNQIVLDETKDVLVKFYAPWCGHCKKLAPIWEQLAADLIDVPNLVIAEMDSTANEVESVDIKGYPTLKFYPKENKKGIDYDGERELENFKTYLTEHSTSYKDFLKEKKSDL